MVNASLFSYLYPHGAIAKTRFYDNFYGDVIDDEWALRQDVGTGAAVIIDTLVNTGLKISTGGGATDRAGIHWSQIQPFDPTSCEFLTSCRLTDTTDNAARFGLFDGGGFSTNYVRINLSTTSSATLRNSDTVGAGNTTFGTTSGYDSFHTYKLRLKGTVTYAWRDDKLEAVNSSNWGSPPTDLEPGLVVESSVSTGVKSVNYGFVEVYNL